MLFVLLFVEFARFFVDQMIATAHFARVHFIRGAVLGHFAQLRRCHVLVRQLSKYLLSSLRNIT